MANFDGQATKVLSNQQILSKAVARAAQRLNINQNELGKIICLSPTAINRTINQYHLPNNSATFQLATLFVRVFRSLDAIVGGDEAVARKWLRNSNSVLYAVPIEQMKTIPGLVSVLAYLDARRALV